MPSIKTFEGQLVANQQRFAIVSSRFNDFMVSQLVAGAIDTLTRHGVLPEQIEHFRVPGAFELPLATKRVALTRKYDAVIALSVIIRGGTPHFDFVAAECSKGLANVSLDTDIPVSFGVITADTIEQAIERSGTKAGNKGSDAAFSALEMTSLFAQIDNES
jgi:6,7-dimethyl-8-ribityllumazine synthase